MTPEPEVFSRLNLYTVLHALPDGVTLADTQGRIVFANAAADRILGVAAATDASPDEWADYYGVFTPDGETPFPVDGYPLVRAIAGEETEGVEMLVRNREHPNGALISVSGKPMRDEAGALIGAAVVFRDITELRRIQRLKDDLRAFVVHDLKSPLTTITASAALIAQDEDHQADVELMEDARAILTAARRVNRMVLDLLDSQVAEDGALEPAVVDVALTELLSDVWEASVGRIGEGDRDRVVIGDAGDLTLRADADLLFRVLMNLVDNCAKYGPRTGRVWLDVHRSDADRLLFTVRDEGPGVPEELREQIFDKYARVERTEGVPLKGSRGLGLRFCKVVADLHGGTIWVEDAEPTGARFCLELPKEPPQPVGQGPQR